jgi:hypothetical protein
MGIKLSKSSKMKVAGKQVKSWDLNAGITCPGSKIGGDVVETCKICYAKKGPMVWPASVALRNHNQQDYKRAEWVSDMVQAIGTYKWFRFLSSGDIESKELGDKIYEVIQRCPSTSFWVPSRSHTIKSIHPSIKRIAGLQNAAMRLSAGAIGLSEIGTGVNSYVIRVANIPEALSKGIHICPVTLPGSAQKSCDNCTICYTDNPVAYLIH